MPFPPSFIVSLEPTSLPRLCLLTRQACDHEECALEWFHYECVGLTAAPVGEWLCPDCVKAKGV